MQQFEIPPRMYASDVLKLAKFGRATLAAKIKRGEFPKHVDRGKEYIFDGRAVYQALGLIDNSAMKSNPWD